MWKYYIPFCLLCPKASQTEVSVFLVAVETVGQDAQFAAVTCVATGERGEREGGRREGGGEGGGGGGGGREGGSEQGYIRVQ